MQRSGILSRWAIVRETDVPPVELAEDGRPRTGALQRWGADAWSAYLEKCPTLRAEISADHLRVELSLLRLGSIRPVASQARVLVATTLTELRPSSVTMAFRIRALGSDGQPVADGRYVVTFFERAGGSPLPIPEHIRRELLVVEAAAADYC